MARRRMIVPEIWQSESFAQLSILAKLVFIGLFSNADDEGRGIANPVYIKSILFPYDDGMRVIDIEKALSEIGQFMSVTLYTHDGRKYYALDNWKKSQTIDRPKPSKLPPPTDEKSISDESPKNRRQVDDLSSHKKKGKEEEEKEKLKEVETDLFCDFSEPMQETLREWLKYKAERRESYKPTGLKKLIAEVKGKLSLYQETAVISLIDECMANGWRGIIWDKLNKKGGFSNVRKSDQESPSGSTAEASKQKYGNYI